MNDSLASTLVLCDLDNLLLGEDGNLTQVVRDVLQLFSSRGGRLTVFSQRSPRAVRSILGSVRLAAPALVCGGTMAYHYADGNRVPLCSFAQQQELFACLPDTPGVGVAVQMQDGTTRVLRMSNALERHLRQEWTPYLLANAADIHPEQVLRVLLYQDSKSVPLSRLKAMPGLSTNRSSTTWGMNGIAPTGCKTCTAHSLISWSMPISAATAARLKSTNAISYLVSVIKTALPVQGSAALFTKQICIDAGRLCFHNAGAACAQVGCAGGCRWKQSTSSSARTCRRWRVQLQRPSPRQRWQRRPRP